MYGFSVDVYQFIDFPSAKTICGFARKFHMRNISQSFCAKTQNFPYLVKLVLPQHFLIKNDFLGMECVSTFRIFMMNPLSSFQKVEKPRIPLIKFSKKLGSSKIFEAVCSKIFLRFCAQNRQNFALCAQKNLQQNREV